jgi:hypothetical protein
MRVPSSLKVILSTWIAALVGALAGRVLAQATGDTRGAQRHAPVVTSAQPR